MLKRAWKIIKISLVIILVLVVTVVALAAFWAHRQMQPRDIWAARQRWPKAMTFEAADRAALDLVSKMTLDEKLDQMTGSGTTPMMLSHAPPRRLRRPVYSGGNDRLGIPPLSFTDGPRGVVSGRSTAFPVAIARAATWDVDLQRRVGDVIGQEARAQGANYWGGLCLNIVRHPSMGRAEETYGEDPWLTGEMGVAILTAVQRHNVMACAKHFALNSMETARFKINVEIDERTLREVYLPHYRKAVEHGVASFMSAYNKVRGEWCGENRHLLTTCCAATGASAASSTSDWDNGVYDGQRGVHAGLDIEMPAPKVYGSGPEDARRGVAWSRRPRSTRACAGSCARSSCTSPARIPSSTRRALPPRPLTRRSRARCPRSRWSCSRTRRRCCRSTRSRVKTLAVVGHLADAANTGDHGSSNVNPPYVTSALKGLRDYLGAGAAVLHSDGADLVRGQPRRQGRRRGRRGRRQPVGRGG